VFIEHDTGGGFFLGGFSTLWDRGILVFDPPSAHHTGLDVLVDEGFDRERRLSRPRGSPAKRPGSLDHFSKAGAELLFDVVGRAHEQTSLIVTTNLPFEQWTEVLGSERLTGARLDRLTCRVHILEVNGARCRTIGPAFTLQGGSG